MSDQPGRMMSDDDYVVIGEPWEQHGCQLAWIVARSLIDAAVDEDDPHRVLHAAPFLRVVSA